MNRLFFGPSTAVSTTCVFNDVYYGPKTLAILFFSYSSHILKRSSMKEFLANSLKSNLKSRSRSESSERRYRPLICSPNLLHVWNKDDFFKASIENYSTRSSLDFSFPLSQLEWSNYSEILKEKYFFEIFLKRQHVRSQMIRHSLCLPETA